MRLSLTEQFLLDLYDIAEEIGDVFSVVLRPYPSMRNVGPDFGMKEFWDKYKKGKNRKSFYNLLSNLKSKGYITAKNLEGKSGIMLTKNGLDKALKASFQLASNTKIKRKDGKWIMVIFDVPEKSKNKRELLRSILQNFGFKMFQKSAWISPYDVGEKTEKALQYHLLDNYVKIFLIEEL